MAFPEPFSLLAGPFLSPPLTDGGGRGPVVFSSTSIGVGNPRNSEPPIGFNALDFLQNYLQNLRARGANVQLVMENHPSGPGLNLPSNLGDYYLGPGLEQVIQQLAENDPNRYGAPPASKRSVQGLPNVVINDALVKSDSNSCAVCMNEFEVGLEVKKMPCSHFFHSDCLLPWLELHNSCPVCRYELPTDDPDYENRRGNRGQGSSSEGAGGSGSGEAGSQGNSNAERGFRISLPWPFNSFASYGGSNDSVGGGGNNNGSSSGGQQSGSRGSEPRQESLD